jgi:hypothetical protein
MWNPIVELHLVSFMKRMMNMVAGDGGHSKIDRDDSCWEEVYELDLFDEDNNDVGASIPKQGLKKM